MASAKYTKYAQWRMHVRKVPEEAVDHVLEHYHSRRPAPRREGALPSVIFIGEYQGRDLKVYVARDSNPPLVTTAVWEGD